MPLENEGKMNDFISSSRVTNKKIGGKITAKSYKLGIFLLEVAVMLLLVRVLAKFLQI